MFIELHIIQNFAPSNLNRDDNGAPKEAMFGGHRRARISSQCLKRAVRLHPASARGMSTQDRGVRTKKLLNLVTERVVALGHADADDVRHRVTTTLAAAGLSVEDDGDTQYLLFLGEREIDGFARVVHEHWDALSPKDGAIDEAAIDGDKSQKKDKKDAKKAKKDNKAAAPEVVQKAVKPLLDGGKAVDVALFGRMLADLPKANQDAACQVAHALSTHRVERDFDFFTAVDDHAPEDNSGAGMIGQVEFNSATFYRYAVLDADKLLSNLQGDSDLALRAIGGFTEAMTRAVPTGKQNTFAAHNPPSFVGVAIRHGSPFNLANAFEKPVWSGRDTSLTNLSVQALAAHERQVSGFYGDAADTWAVLDATGAWPVDVGTAKPSVAELAAWVTEQVRSAAALAKA